MRHQGYDSEDSIDTWTLTPEDHALVAGKSRVNRLGFAVLLLFFRANGRFPEASEIHPSIVARVAEQLGTNNGPILDQAWHSRTGKRHRAEIRVLFGFREPTVADAEEMAAWLRDHAVAHSRDPDYLAAALKAHCRSSSIEPPRPERIDRIVRAAYVRGRAITDGLVDLLIETIHHIGARAERKVERELLEDLKRVSGKQNLLFELADAALTNPDGIVREVVYPVVGEQTLRDLVKEWKATGPTYRTTLRTVIRNSYQGHYRRMVPKLLAALEFRSNNERHRPVMQALELVKRFADTKLRTFPAEEEVPLDGVVRGLWRRRRGGEGCRAGRD